MIPEKGWKPMEAAPTDGGVIMVLYREWNHPTGKRQVQPAQFLCDLDGTDWRWRIPYRPGTVVYADGWMTLENFKAAQKAEGFANESPKINRAMKPHRPDLVQPAPAVEFDL